MSDWKQFEAQVSGWPNIATQPHRFGGREFRLGSAEVGHVHTGGIVDIPFPRAIQRCAAGAGFGRGASLASKFRLDHLSDAQPGRSRPRLVADADFVSTLCPEVGAGCSRVT